MVVFNRVYQWVLSNGLRSHLGMDIPLKWNLTLYDYNLSGTAKLNRDQRTGRKVSAGIMPLEHSLTDIGADKENDVVARAKLEAKKKFSAESSEAQRQEWIEQRIKEDYERLLNRLAAQFHGEIGHLRPFQLGFADYYF